MQSKNTANSSNSSAMNKSSNILAEALSSTLASNSREEKEIDNFTKNKIILDSLINDRSITSRKDSFATDNCHLRQNE
jgi:hypothetical protein